MRLANFFDRQTNRRYSKYIFTNVRMLATHPRHKYNVLIFILLLPGFRKRNESSFYISECVAVIDILWHGHRSYPRNMQTYMFYIFRKKKLANTISICQLFVYQRTIVFIKRKEDKSEIFYVFRYNKVTRIEFFEIANPG